MRMHRARRALPGMVMTLVLSAPLCGHAWGATAAGAETGVGHDQKAAHAKPAVKAAVVTHRAASAHGSSTAGRTLEIKAAPGRVRTSSAKVRPSGSAVVPLGHGGLIRRASLRGAGGTIDRSLIDDGTLWRERGGVATWQQTGMASWYGGSKWQGHPTSSGSRYDQNELTAAHATLPLGTKVRVMRHDGQRSVIVTINDRPGTRTRIIDLSRAAARELGILDSGVTMVTLQPL